MAFIGYQQANSLISSGKRASIFGGGFWQTTLIASGIALASTGLATTLITLLVGQYQERMTEMETLRRRVSEDEGVIGTYSSDSDPLFAAFLMNIITTAQEEIRAVGLGLGFFAHNPPILDAIASRVKQRKHLTVKIQYGGSNNPGVLARVEEETNWNKFHSYEYDPNWLTRYPNTIRDRLRMQLSVEQMHRVSVEPCWFMPMLMVILVDETLLVSLYGTPGMRGSETPWIAINRRAPHGQFAAFIDRVFEGIDAGAGAGALT
jgi:hypothetical protein